jgi:uncharacterized membrane protein
VTVLWIAIGAGIVVLAALRLWAMYRAAETPMLGTVSDQWLAEQRLNRPDTHR